MASSAFGLKKTHTAVSVTNTDTVSHAHFKDKAGLDKAIWSQPAKSKLDLAACVDCVCVCFKDKKKAERCDIIRAEHTKKKKNQWWQFLKSIMMSVFMNPVRLRLLESVVAVRSCLSLEGEGSVKEKCSRAFGNHSPHKCLVVCYERTACRLMFTKCSVGPAEGTPESMNIIQ